jgi:putative membrane protein
MLPPTINKNDQKAKLLIYAVSIIVFAAVVILSKVKLSVSLPFNPHVFATVSAIINSLVAVLLLAGLITVKQKKYALHKKIMMSAIILSVLFLLSYISHHLLTDDTKFGDVNHDGIVSLVEKKGIENVRMIYYFILLTHIPLAGIILPFILFTAYRALIGEYDQHKKLTRITWPIWFYVAVTGVIVYSMISPYYN